jgi:secondary thiamine-phosphate synthase enzyme
VPLATLDISTSQRSELVDITQRVRSVVRGANLESGVVYVYCPHTTAGVTIQENTDPDVRHDLLLSLDNAVPGTPTRGEYRHGEGNSPAHVKAALVGASQVVPVDKGKLVLGTWQAIYLCEFDGPRNRRILLQLLAG